MIEKRIIKRIPEGIWIQNEKGNPIAFITLSRLVRMTTMELVDVIFKEGE